MLSQEKLKQYQEEGFFILENAIPAEMLKRLQAESAEWIKRIDSEMDAKGTDVEGLNRRGSRYFINNRHEESRVQTDFLFSREMSELAHAVLGKEAYLFWELMVIKGPEKGMAFSWHQDSGYLKDPKFKPYLTCWCALDDMSEANGTAYVLPYDKAPQSRNYIEHWKDPKTNDMIGYDGEEPGTPALVKAGSIVCFSSFLLHRSGFNTTKNYRRAYVCQYSAEKILKPDGSPVGFAKVLPK